MSEIDLNIENYTIDEVKKFFNINPNEKNIKSAIELKEYEIREILLSSGNIDKKFTRNLIIFLEKAKNILQNENKNTIPVSKQNDEIITFQKNIEKSSKTREYELIEHRDAPFVFANNSEFYSGNLNPLNTRVIPKYIVVDTRFRENLHKTDTCDFTINLPTKISKVVSMQLTAIELPITFYGISSQYGNNYLYIYLNTQSYRDGPIDEYEAIFCIPDGNYTPSDLLSTINNVLVSSDVNPIFYGIEFILDINTNGSGSGKVIVKRKDDENGKKINTFGLDFTKNIDGVSDRIDVSTRIGWSLGFTQKKYYGNYIYVSDSPMSNISMRYIYLGIDDYQKSANNLFLTAFHETTLNDSILARISLKNSFNLVMTENNYNLITEPRKYFGPVDIQKLRIRLFDNYGRLLATNQTNYSFVLLFNILYDL